MIVASRIPWAKRVLQDAGVKLCMQKLLGLRLVVLALSSTLAAIRMIGRFVEVSFNVSSCRAPRSDRGGQHPGHRIDGNIGRLGIC